MSVGTTPKKRRLFSRESSSRSEKKASPGLASSPKVRTSALTPEDHVLRQLSLRYFADQSLTVKEVAKKLNTQPKKIKSFFDDPEYVEELNDRIEKVHGVGTEFMQSQAKISLLHLYEEMRRREVEGELKEIPLRELHKIIVDTQKELRLDTPGAFTSKVGVADLTNLQDRYNRSLSGRFHKAKTVSSKKKALPAPDNDQVEEGDLSVRESDQSQARGIG